MKSISILFLSVCFAATAYGSPFTAQQKEQLIVDCEKEIDIALKIAHNYQSVEIGFKVLIFVLTLGVATTSIIIAARGAKPKNPLSVSNAILAAIISASSAFAVTTFNFSAQHSSWQDKADAFAVLRDDVKYSDPDSADFLRRMEAARRADKDAAARHSPAPPPANGK